LRSQSWIKIVGAILVFGVICAAAAWFGACSGGVPGGPWYSIVPPLLAIVLAFLTRHVALSLGIAIAAGGLLTAVPQEPLSAAAWLSGFKAVGLCVIGTVRDIDNLKILAFIPPIFVMIEVMFASGGFRGIIRWLLRWIRGRKSAQAATALTGVLCFIDDYTNAIVVGSMMRPVTDRFKVSREKLAFIVDATSAPVAGLAVISTWIAYEVGVFGDIAKELEIDKTGYAMFFDALQFRFYCVLMLVFVFLHIVLGRDFGPMKAAERRAAGGPSAQAPTTGTAGRSSEAVVGNHGRAVNALVPLGGLILVHLTGLWLDGGGPQKLSVGGSLVSLGYWRDVISGARNSTVILTCAALAGLGLALLCWWISGSLNWRILVGCIGRGLRRAMIPFVILILAWSLKSSCDALATGEFLKGILADKVPASWFPTIVFLVACVTSFSTGTSYGTMAILIPTAIPIAFALDGEKYGVTTMICLGAVLDGAIFGDHCSPISDTTIISSMASSCELMSHVRTQLPYSLFVAGLVVVCAYVPSGFGMGPGWCIAAGVVVMACILGVLPATRD
jgi:Na+/H+ antiporter NhaC